MLPYTAADSFKLMYDSGRTSRAHYSCSVRGSRQPLLAQHCHSVADGLLRSSVIRHGLRRFDGFSVPANCKRLSFSDRLILPALDLF
jgi:hypothetical protein